MTKPAAFTAWPATLPFSYGPFPAVVDRIIDGDTFCVYTSVGFDHYPYIAVRLLAASSPELSTPEGKEAKAFLESILPVGSKVILRTDKIPGSTFTRWLASVLMEDGRDLATVLVDAQMAQWGSFQG